MGYGRSTYSTLFGLLVVTGMRVSEPIGLDRNDVDLTEGILTIRQTSLASLDWYLYTPPLRRH